MPFNGRDSAPLSLDRGSACPALPASLPRSSARAAKKRRVVQEDDDEEDDVVAVSSDDDDDGDFEVGHRACGGVGMWCAGWWLVKMQRAGPFAWGGALHGRRSHGASEARPL